MKRSAHLCYSLPRRAFCTSGRLAKGTPRGLEILETLGHLATQRRRKSILDLIHNKQVASKQLALKLKAADRAMVQQQSRLHADPQQHKRRGDRRFRTFNVVDDFNREGLAIEVDLICRRHASCARSIG